MRARSLVSSIAVAAGILAVPLGLVTAPPAVAAPAGVAEVSAALDGLAVKGRAPKTGYERARFGDAWSDAVDVPGGRNGCDTRNDILGRDLTEVTYREGTRNCVVLTGTLDDPYTGSTIAFDRSRDASAVQIDHVVALSDAWQKGAQPWTDAKRRDFANDPLNLLAVSGRANQQKGDGDAATWLPADKSFRCDYVARQVAVKHRYGLWVTAAEKEAISRVLDACRSVSLDRSHFGATAVYGDAASRSEQRPRPQQPQQQTRPAAPQPQPEVYYRNCSEARAAGAAPILRGQPGYRSGLDGDNDGIACESRR